jgi:GNAT superfamily N-acetyltransferase
MTSASSKNQAADSKSGAPTETTSAADAAGSRRSETSQGRSASLRLAFRLAVPVDIRFVASSWFESYRRGGFAPEVAFEVYKAGQGSVIDTRIAWDDAVIATHPDVPDEICGWMVRSRAPAACHYIYVKQAYRRRGIATQLASVFGGFKEHTHETKAGRHLAAKLGSKFNPYSLFNLIPREKV